MLLPVFIHSVIRMTLNITAIFTLVLASLLLVNCLKFKCRKHTLSKGTKKGTKSHMTVWCNGNKREFYCEDENFRISAKVDPEKEEADVKCCNQDKCQDPKPIGSNADVTTKASNEETTTSNDDEKTTGSNTVVTTKDSNEKTTSSNDSENPEGQKDNVPNLSADVTNLSGWCSVCSIIVMFMFMF